MNYVHWTIKLIKIKKSVTQGNSSDSYSQALEQTRISRQRLIQCINIYVWIADSKTSEKHFNKKIGGK